MQDLMKFDIGVMPLKETDWERGKCGFKLIQYMALEIPSVASAFGANLEIVENKELALLVKKDPEEWKNALRSLMNDKLMRKEMGRLARLRIMEAYSKKAVQQDVLDLFS